VARRYGLGTQLRGPHRRGVKFGAELNFLARLEEQRKAASR